MLAITATAAALTVLLVALMAVPVALVVEAEREDALKVRWRVRWLYGLVDVGTSPRQPAPPTSERSEPAKPARTSETRRWRRARMGVAVLRTRGLARRAQRTAFTLFRHIRVRELQARAAFGFDDPADTGMVYGCLSPFLVMAGARGLRVECRPMFLESGLRGVLRATVDVRPLAVIGTLVGFVLSRPALRAMVSAWRARK